MVYALDALFGLPRKKAAGSSFRPAILGKLFFCNQESVDEFVSAEASNDKKILQVSHGLMLFLLRYMLSNPFRIVVILLLEPC